MSERKKGFLNGLYKYPWLIICIIGIITVFFAFQLPRAELDNNNIRFVPEDDESRLINQYISDMFGSSFFILIALERNYGDIFDAAFLNRIREFNRRIEDFEIVGSINSIVSSDYIFAEDDSIIVAELVGEDFTGSPAEIAILKERVLSWDIYRHTLVSDDFRATQILIPLDITDEQASEPEIMAYFIEIRDIALDMFRGYGEVYVTGLPVIAAVINEAMQTDLIIMIPLVILVVLIVLFVSFRHFTPVILPLITVLTAVIWSVGAMPLVGIKLSVITTVLPVILIAVGSAYGIHLVTHYLKDVDVLRGLSRMEHKDMILGIIRKVGKSVFLAAFTTVAGFFSFCFTSVIPIREFGFFATFGVFSAFLIAITLIPSLLIIRGPRQRSLSKNSVSFGTSSDRRTTETPALSIDLSIARFFTGIAGRKTAVITAVIFIAGFSILGLTNVKIDNIFVEYFKETSDISRSDRFIREKFGGSKILNIVVEADSTEELLMPEVLNALDSLGVYLETRVSEVGKVMGFTDLIKRVNQIFNADESPDGLTPRAALSDDSYSFDSFGFDDFGFWDFGFIENNESAGDDVSGNNEKHDALLNIEEIVSLFRRALASGISRSGDRNIGAEILVREMERLVNFGGMAYYEIPSDPARYGLSTPEELSQLVANYLILLSSNIDEYANDSLSPTALKTTVQLRTLGNIDTVSAVDKINNYFAHNLPDNITAIIGGSAMIEVSLNRLVVRSQIISIIISVFVVFLIITFSNRSITAGLIGIAPITVCILINFAIMGFAGIKLNIGTSMIASLCIGIGVDYSIHCMEAYKREYREGLKAGGSNGGFLLRTFASSGRAIIINALSVGVGFAILLFSQFVMLQHLGLLIALAMVSSALVCLTFMPALLLIIKPKFIYTEVQNEK